MPPLKTQFHTYLIGSSKQFLQVVIFHDACHQTHRKSVFFPPLLLCHGSVFIIRIFQPRLR